MASHSPPALPALIAALLKPASWPDRPESVELRQTHISYLFFTPTRVYKIKKPVDFGFLDFTTLERRLRFCSEEVRLNRRLAKGVYLGVAPIVERTDGVCALEPDEESGDGEVLEYAVVMKRLPEGSALEALIKADITDEATAVRIAEHIARFHLLAERGGHIDEFGAPEMIERNAEENFSQTEPFIGKGKALSKERFEEIRAYTRDFLRTNRELLTRRIKDGRVRDCHGDIHSDHVYVNDEIEIIDCIEFNERFRFSDTVSDAAFLAMDMDFLSRGDLARTFEGAYLKAAGDEEGTALMDFYKCYRAVVRGKVESFKLAEEEVSDTDKELSLINAARHFHLAAQYAAEGHAPLLIVVCGLSGTGKSTIAKLINKETAVKSFASDVVRKELAGLDPAEHRYDDFGAGLYTEEMTKQTYSELFNRAFALLKTGRSVLLDATFSKRAEMEKAKEIASEAGAELHIVECTASDSTVRERMEKRAKEASVSDARYETYLKQKKARDNIEEEKITLSTEGRPDEAAAHALKEIFG